MFTWRSYDSQILHHNLCFNLFILNSNPFGNQGSKINKNNMHIYTIYYLSICLFIYLSIYLYLSLYIYIYTIYLYFYMIYMYICLCNKRKLWWWIVKKHKILKSPYISIKQDNAFRTITIFFYPDSCCHNP